MKKTVVKVCMHVAVADCADMEKRVDDLVDYVQPFSMPWWAELGVVEYSIGDADPIIVEREDEFPPGYSILDDTVGQFFPGDKEDDQ